MAGPRTIELFPRDDVFSLKQVLDLAAGAVAQALPERFWMIAEVAEIKDRSGHVYIDLVQKERGVVVAKTRAMIWQSNARSVLNAFASTTGRPLSAGMSALMCVVGSLHALYGLGFTIHAIDGDYTLGEMARQKRETIERLSREGLMTKNKALTFPVVAQRIAVISSATAAGCEDFLHQIEGNVYGYRFRVKLFEALLQGEQAERSMIAAIRQVALECDRFDALVIIRGGGSKVDLNCFDCYGLARELAQFPLPVVAGIGHERDESVVDMVCHHRCKTPTAVAEFLIGRMREFEDGLADQQMRLVRASRAYLQTGAAELERAVRRIQSAIVQSVARQDRDLRVLEERLHSAAASCLEREKHHVDRLADKVQLLDPINVLRRGYSLVYFGDELMRSAAQAALGQSLRIRLASGALAADVTDIESPPDLSPKEDARAI